MFLMSASVVDVTRSRSFNAEVNAGDGGGVDGAGVDGAGAEATEGCVRAAAEAEVNAGDGGGGVDGAGAGATEGCVRAAADDSCALSDVAARMKAKSEQVIPPRILFIANSFL
jgi:hypothetical protein